MISLDEYPLWHGGRPMSRVLRDTLSEDRFLVEGTGIRVRDKGGRWYLDARSSLWNMSLGYDHPKVIEALRTQLDRLPFGTLLSYGRPPDVTVQFARALVDHLPAELRHVRMGSTGSQMTEGAVLLSRFFRRATGTPERTAVISFEGSYHGMGAGATTLSGAMRGANNWAGPPLPDVHYVSPVGSWTTAFRERVADLGVDRVTAVIIEPFMGSTGILPGDDDLRLLRDLCTETGIHLIADEVTTGYGRTGHLSRMLQLGIVPDILLLSKGITAGYMPLAALVANDMIFDPLFELSSGEAFLHGSTTDGHPLAAAVGLAVLEVLYADGLMETVGEKGEVLQSALATVSAKHLPGADVTGVGLMRRLWLRDREGITWPMADIDRFHAACEDAGVLSSVGDDCLLFLPPLITTAAECEEIADRVASAAENFTPSAGE